MWKRSGMALGIVIAARGLDRAFERLGAGIGEEHLVGEGGVDQPLAERLLAGDLVEVGQVPDLVGLLLQRLDQMRMAVAERVDRDAGAEIEISLAVFGDQPDALASLEPQRAHADRSRKAGAASAMARSPVMAIGKRTPAKNAGPKNQKCRLSAASRHYLLFRTAMSTKSGFTASRQSRIRERYHQQRSVAEMTRRPSKLGKTWKFDSCGFRRLLSRSHASH